MPVPKRKHSKARRDSRNANKGVEVKSFGACSNCGDAVRPHVVCQGCGFYGGKKVLRTKNDRGVVRDEQRKAQETKQRSKQPVAQEEKAE
jgi:large subunit ribosomal protein L32